MPGANCGFLGCHTNRKTRDVRNPNRYLSLFQIPTIRDGDSDYTKELKQKTRDEWIRIVCETRLRDTALQRQFDEGKFYLCELHFDPENMEIFPTRRTLNLGSVPTRHLPRKSLEKSDHQKEGMLNCEAKQPLISSLPVVYSNTAQAILGSFVPMKMSQWRLEDHGEHLWLAYDDPSSWVPKFLVIVSKMSSSLVSYYYGWRVPADSVRAHSLTTVLKTLESSFICTGLPVNCLNQDTMIHSITKKPCNSAESQPQDSSSPPPIPFSVDHKVRSKNCSILVFKENEQCTRCDRVLKKQDTREKMALARKFLPAKRKAPLSACSKEKLVATVQASRLHCAQLEEKLGMMRQELSRPRLQVIIQQEANTTASNVNMGPTMSTTICPDTTAEPSTT